MKCQKRVRGLHGRLDARIAEEQVGYDKRPTEDEEDWDGKVTFFGNYAPQVCGIA
jgi:hypothetical protein